MAGHARKGSTLPVVARYGDWYELSGGRWIYGGKGFVAPNSGAKSAPKAKVIPPTPTPRPTPKPTATPRPRSSLPPMQDVVVLGPNTKFPVRARVFRGWGYEIVDKSKKWDVVMYRDVLGYVLHKATHPDGTPLVDWKKYTNGVRFTIMDPYYGGHCPRVLHLGNITIRIPEDKSEAPVQLNDWAGTECTHWAMASEGDGAGAQISYGCTFIYHNPRECFIAIHRSGPYLTSLVVSTFRDALNVYFHEFYDRNKSPYTLMGTAHKDQTTSQWHWTNPFLKVVPATP